MPRTVASRFEVGPLVGGGATGSVYAGMDTLTGQKVAIKALREELVASIPDLVERFRREGEALRRLNHPNIVKVLATADHELEHFIVMEYVSGGSLANLLCKQPQLPLDRAVTIALELSDALSRAHHLNILHRDMKPANILLAEDGTPRLTDFGLARLGGLPGLTETGSILGTFQYLSPEVVENQDPDERSDIWSFGIILFEMIAGRRPFNGETPFEIIWAIKNQPLPAIEKLRSGVPPSLADLLKRMLRKDRPARVSSVRQVGAELEKIQKDLEEKAFLESTGGSQGGTTSLPPKIRVLVVDDHAVVRQGLRTLIDLQLDMEVVGEGENGVEAVEQADSLRPDVVLLDLIMPEMDGVKATAEIRKRSPETRVIILTSFGEDDKVFPAIRAGAQGYLLKTIRPEELVQSIRETWQGKAQMHPDVVQKLISALTEGPSKAEIPAKTTADPDKTNAASNDPTK